LVCEVRDRLVEVLDEQAHAHARNDSHDASTLGNHRSAGMAPIGHPPTASSARAVASASGTSVVVAVGASASLTQYFVRLHRFGSIES
jgi:hypothetical protein